MPRQWFDRPSYGALAPSERAVVLEGFRDVQQGSVTPCWDDSRAQLLEWAHSMLEEVLSGELDEDENRAACWAIGRDVATARYLRAGRVAHA